eukprot:scaffold176571_cov21-Tisochrysis_lutea.AAC.2
MQPGCDAAAGCAAVESSNCTAGTLSACPSGLCHPLSACATPCHSISTCVFGACEAMGNAASCPGAPCSSLVPGGEGAVAGGCQGVCVSVCDGVVDAAGCVDASCPAAQGCSTTPAEQGAQVQMPPQQPQQQQQQHCVGEVVLPPASHCFPLSAVQSLTGKKQRLAEVLASYCSGRQHQQEQQKTKWRHMDGGDLGCGLQGGLADQAVEAEGGDVCLCGLSDIEWDSEEAEEMMDSEMGWEAVAGDAEA